MKNNIHNFMENIKNNFFQDFDRGILWFFILFCIGNAVYFALPFVINVKYIYIVLASLFVGFFACFKLYKYKDKPCFVVVKIALMLVGCFFLGLLNVSRKVEKSDTIFLSEKVKKSFISGRVRRVEVLDNSYRILIDNLWLPDKYRPQKEMPNTARVKVRGQKFYPKVGSYIKFTGSLSPPPKASTLRGFNFARYAYFKDIDSIGSVFYELEYNEKFMKSRKRPKDSFFEKVSFSVENMRREINLFIKNNVEEGDSKQIIYSLVTGERYSAGFDLSDKFLAVGITHILSISGFHMGIIAFMTFFLIRLIAVRIHYISDRFDAKKISLAISILPITFYLLISGARLPTVRAYIMVLMFIIALLFNKNAFSKRTVFVSAFLIVLFLPESIINPGFLMSFSSVLALVSIYENFSHYGVISSKLFLFKNNGRRGNGLIKNVFGRVYYFLYLSFLTNMTAWLFTLPFAIYFFKKTSLISVFANLMIVPVFSFIVMPLIFLLYLSLGVVWLKSFILSLMVVGVDFMVMIIDWIYSFYSDVVLTPALPRVSIWLCTFGLLWFFAWKARWKKWGLFFVVISFIPMMFDKTPDLIISYEANIITFNNGKNGLVFKNIRKGRMSTYSLISISEEFAWKKDFVNQFKKNSKYFCKKDFCVFNAGDGKILYLTDYFDYENSLFNVEKYLNDDVNNIKYIVGVDETIWKDIDWKVKSPAQKILFSKDLKDNIVSELYFLNNEVELKSFKEKNGFFKWNLI